MVNSSKTKLIKEIKDYNKELSKHLPKVDFQKAIELKGALEKKSDDEDFYSLLTSNFIELRTEVALLRKNLSNDIESMVLRQVNELQTKFLKQLTNFSSKIVFDIKANLGNYVKELNNNVLDIKREFNKISTKNELIENRFDELRESTLDFKSYIEKLEYSQNEAFKDLTDEIEKISRQNLTNFTKVEDRLNSEIKTSREIYRQVNQNVEKSHLLIKKEITQLKAMKEDLQKPNLENIENLIEEKPEIEENLNHAKNEVDENEEENKYKEKLLKELALESPPKQEDVEKKRKKFLEIDQKIRTLQSLK